MTHQQALKILMLSPVYFKLDPYERMQLIKEYCQQFSEVTKKQVTIQQHPTCTRSG